MSKHKTLTKSQCFVLVPRLGFEPRLPGPEPGVLPLDDLGVRESRGQAEGLDYADRTTGI